MLDVLPFVAEKVLDLNFEEYLDATSLGKCVIDATVMFGELIRSLTD